MQLFILKLGVRNEELKNDDGVIVPRKPQKKNLCSFQKIDYSTKIYQNLSVIGNDKLPQQAKITVLIAR